MPYRTEFTDRGVIHVCSGIVTGEELVAVARESNSSPGRRGVLEYGQVDFTAVTELRVNNAELRRVANEDQITAARFAPTAVVALVTPSSAVSGVVRVWQILTETTGWQSEMFKTRDEAERWIESKITPP